MDFLGSQPNGINEYQCPSCKICFELRQDDEQLEEVEEHSDPNFCPYCGKATAK
jgi:hypothetical protein